MSRVGARVGVCLCWERRKNCEPKVFDCGFNVAFCLGHVLLLLMQLIFVALAGPTSTTSNFDDVSATSITSTSGGATSAPVPLAPPAPPIMA